MRACTLQRFVLGAACLVASFAPSKLTGQAADEATIARLKADVVSEVRG